jgi:DNA-binding protein HU-beta
MNKHEIVEEMSERCDFTKAEAGRSVASILEVISDGLKAHDEINLPGFGKFVTQERKARDAADPRDRSRTIRVAAATVPKFRPGAALRAAVADVEPTQTPKPRPPAGDRASVDPRPAGDRGSTAGADDWRPLSQRA